MIEHVEKGMLVFTRIKNKAYGPFTVSRYDESTGKWYCTRHSGASNSEKLIHPADMYTTRESAQLAEDRPSEYIYYVVYFVNNSFKCGEFYSRKDFDTVSGVNMLKQAIEYQDNVKNPVILNWRRLKDE